MNKRSALLLPSDDMLLASDDRWQLVQRIAASPGFAKALQLQKILLYVARLVLIEHATAISEQDIACGVLGRRGDFNPSEDNIVRVQMGHLRKRLDQYFAGEGRHEPLVVTVPRGAYLLHFEERSQAALLQGTEAGFSHFESESMQRPPAPERGVSRPVRWYALLVLAVAGCVALVCVWVFGRATKRALPETRAAAPSAPQNPFVKRIFASDWPITIVVADTNLVIIQNTLHTDITIDQYISRDYPYNIINNAADPAVRKIFAKLARRKFTSISDLQVAMKCVELSRDFGTRSSIHFARAMNARDFEKGNFILIGSRTGDPWVELFEHQLNFAFEEDPQTHQFHFRNRHPMKGEQAVYDPVLGENVSTVSYVDIAIVPNLTKTGYGLLFNAATSDGNEAAMELLFSRDLPESLMKVFKADANIGSEPIEILLRSHAVDGVVSGLEVVGVRHGATPEP